jgi:A/G-specific adenine glycosylase
MGSYQRSVSRSGGIHPGASILIPAGFRRALLRWYDAAHRDLPWRRSKQFYGVWVSEIMLQQTRVEAVIPYYRHFLERFPSIETLASAPENDVLTAWSGLGYYSRVRNLHRAAKKVTVEGLPTTYQDILTLPGVGPYTAAAIASIALDLPYAAVDGNVVRVISRLNNDASEITSTAARRRFAGDAGTLLDPHRPGDFNQAMMELGATICLSGTPRCGFCPTSKFCAAHAAGTERELPVRLKKGEARDIPIDLAILERKECILLTKRASSERRLADFWELPEKHLFPRLHGTKVSEFSHRIVNDRFRVNVWQMTIGKFQPRGKPGPERDWVPIAELPRIPLTTVTKKAIKARISSTLR